MSTTTTPRPIVNETERLRIVIVLALRDYQIPEHMHGGVLRYVLDGIVPGEFLLALLCNEMLQAQAQADPQNAEAFARWQTFLLQAMPTGSWGAKRIVADWITAKGLNGKAGDVTPRSVPVLPAAPSNRPKPSTLLMLSADINARVCDAMKHLGEIMGRIPEGFTSDEIRYALNDLAIARTSLDALAAECRKGV